METLSDKILKWSFTCNTGVSSETMACCAVGIKRKRQSTPSDPSDLNRCLILVEQIPEIADYFEKISEISPRWKTVIDNWNKLRTTFIDEVGWNWSKSKEARKTYELMKELGL